MKMKSKFSNCVTDILITTSQNFSLTGNHTIFLLLSLKLLYSLNFVYSGAGKDSTISLMYTGSTLF